ncbi:TonB-dependent receptor domain-containing protein [Caulobacter sp. ErkDOM-YI]|uniref:TonB-dependent receptor domain-containing protein n=1 Tax=unclassified Caulobacter TaxID=2648921 RepID=UPI003AF85406
MRLKLLFVATAMVLPGLAMAQTILAQTPPAQAPAAAKPVDKSAPTAVEGVVVTSDSTAMRTSIDRRSYSVANDLSARTGSIADALRNVPSVEVDVQGNVSLRGDPNVTILIDGKPSGQFNGDGKADALQSLPADQIDRVEVMTNPSAAFRPDGSAGIINLITKKTQKPGVNGSVRANVGSGERYNGGISATRRAGKLTLSGDAGYRRDIQQFVSETDRGILDQTSGRFLPSTQDLDSQNESDSLNLRGGLDYDLDKQNRLSAEVRYRGMAMDSDSRELYAARNAAGAVSRSYERLTQGEMNRDNGAVSADWRRQLTGAGHELTAHAEYEVTSFSRAGQGVTRNSPGVDSYETFGFGIDQTRANLKVDYVKPLPGDVKLKAGVDLEVGENDYDNRRAVGPAPGALVVDTARTNRFLYDQDVFAAYVTYERPFGDFTVQGGLRAEQVKIDTNQLTSAQKNSNDDFKIYPSLFLSHTLNENNTLSANYSRRIQRPQAQDLNPYPVYQDPYNYRAGNPDLKPQQTDAFELGWQYRKGQTSYLATLYHRGNTQSVTDVVTDLGGGVLLTTKQNLGKNNSTGLELAANGRLTPTLTYSVSSNIFRNEIAAANLGFSGTREDTMVSGRANLNWQVTPKDFLQLNAISSGRRLTPQGYREPFRMLNLGYRRKINDKLSFVVTGQDVLNTIEDTVIIDTPTLRDTTSRQPRVRAVFVGFTYLFGGGKQREPGFDFSGAQVGN